MKLHHDGFIGSQETSVADAAGPPHAKTVVIASRMTNGSVNGVSARMEVDSPPANDEFDSAQG